MVYIGWIVFKTGQDKNPVLSFWPNMTYVHRWKEEILNFQSSASLLTESRINKCYDALKVIHDSIFGLLDFYLRTSLVQRLRDPSHSYQFSQEGKNTLCP